MKIKRFKQYLEERRLGGRIYKSSYTSMLDVIKNFQGKQARFVVDHQDKFRFGNADELIHWNIAVDDANMDYLDIPYEQVSKMFTDSGKYAGYVDMIGKQFSVATIDGDMYNKVRNPSGKIKMIIDFLEKKGLERLPDGDWPR